MGGAARTAEDHRYEYCGDGNCPRWPCQVYKQGYEDGHRRGYDEGHAQGYAEGYDEGFQAGIDACPRPHGKELAVMTQHILIAFAAFALWVGSLYVKPFGRCLLCRGKGNLHRKGRRRAPICPLCKGRKRRQRTGSRTVHRTVRLVRAELARTRKLRESKP